MIFVNFKTYRESTGELAVSLAQVIGDVASETGVEIVACPQAADLREVVKVSNHPVWAQHIDVQERGRATGWFPAEIAKGAGAEGTLLNHSEHKLSVGVLAEVLARCRTVGLKSLVFADDLKEAKIIAKLQPDLIGYEPPELVGSKTTSVAKSKPEVIANVVKAIPEIPILIGAGVKDIQDVKVGLKRGAKGIGVSSAVVLAEDPKKALEELAKGFK
jgi:triosephosphate isomerase